MLEEKSLKRIFVKTTISSRLKCPICLEVFQRPRRLFCGHTFCKSCLKTLFLPHKNPQNVPKCPLCRQNIDVKNIGYDLITCRIISQLHVICPVQGCPWKGQNQLLQTHYNFECKMKDYMKNGTKNKQVLMIQEGNQKEDQIRQKINQNIEKGSLIARVISKNPSLVRNSLNQPQILIKKSQKTLSVQPLKVLVTVGTQTCKNMKKMKKKQTKRHILNQNLSDQSYQKQKKLLHRPYQYRNHIIQQISDQKTK